jgi:glycosyltransferase involved in cell wall biosynthesis
MNIGIDVSVLYVARAGVWNYHLNLLEALIQYAPLTDSLTLVDHAGIHGKPDNLAILSRIVDSRTTWRRFGGVRHRKLARLPALQESSLLPLSKRVDQLLEQPWGWASETTTRRQFERGLSDLDVFHVSDVVNFSIPGVKTVTTIHDLTTLLYPEYHTEENIVLLDKKYRFAQEEADAVIAISESTRQDIVNLLGIDPRRIRVVPYGCDARFRPLDNQAVERELLRWKLTPDSYLLYVGTIEPRKNLERLLQAFSKIRMDLPDAASRLVLAGAVGWKSKDFLAQIERLGLQSDVVLLGSLSADELPFLYSGARMLVYPSLYEGFGFPPLEAMASGTPVITSSVSSMPEVVGDSAVLINPLKVDELAAAILELASDAGKRQMLREAGLKRAAQFTWQKAALQTLEVYKDVVSS